MRKASNINNREKEKQGKTQRKWRLYIENKTSENLLFFWDREYMINIKKKASKENYKEYLEIKSVMLGKKN